jgi:hypothetical protein
VKLANIIIPTGVARTGMTVREGFNECLRRGVPSIPHVNENGSIDGRFSIRETMCHACIPDIMVNYADLLGDAPGCLQIPEEHARHVLDLQLDHFVLQEFFRISPDTSIATIVALMEKHGVNSLYVISQDRFIGVVTIWAIAQRMLEL